MTLVCKEFKIPSIFFHATFTVLIKENQKGGVRVAIRGWWRPLYNHIDNWKK